MCGIVGVYSEKLIDIMPLLKFGMLALQHRGQEGSGILLSDGKTCPKDLHIRRLSPVKSSVEHLFAKRSIPFDRKYSLAMGHNRYGTAGTTKNPENIQPFLHDTKYGPLGIGHNGTLSHAKRIREELKRQGDTFFSDSDTEIIPKMVARSKRDNLAEAIVETLSGLQGSFSLLFMTKDKLIAARDPFGIRPLCLGEFDYGYVVASEKSALDEERNIKFLREIERGEVLVIDKNGLKSTVVPIPANAAHCIFELIYFARPDSFQFGHDVATFRMQTGELFAKRFPMLVDAVVPVPDSAMYFAQGYSNHSKIPLHMALLRNHYLGRTFINPGKKDIGAKLSMINILMRGLNLLILEDSIMRGTTSEQVVRRMIQHGAKSVHMGVACPPTISFCNLGIDIKSSSELAMVHLGSKEKIREFIGVDSLNYLPMEDLREAAGNADDFCYGCFTGKYPI